MATGFAPGTANNILNLLVRGAAWTPPAGAYVKLHVGDPGAAGTANPATNTTRQRATFGSAASGGLISNTVALTWTNVSGTEDYTHYSVWDSATVGTFLFSGTVTANAVTTGDNFTIPIGDLDLAIPVAA